MEKQYYNNTTVVVDTTLDTSVTWEHVYAGGPVNVPGKPTIEINTDKYAGIKRPVHVNMTSSEIDIYSVIDQLNSDSSRFPNVSYDDMLKGNIDYLNHEFKDERDIFKDPTIYTDYGTIDPSTMIFTDKDGNKIDIIQGVSDNPNDPIRFDGNKDGIPDINQWNML